MPEIQKELYKKADNYVGFLSKLKIILRNVYSRRYQ